MADESDTLIKHPWITPELIEHTLRVWQRHSPTPLTRKDAIEIVLAFARLADTFALPVIGKNHLKLQISNTRH